MKNENEKMQEVLANFTSEELLYEVHKRRDIYVGGWYNAEHITENTGLNAEYVPHFIKWAEDTYTCEDLEIAVEQWLDEIKEELHTYLVDRFLDIMTFGGCNELGDNHFCPQCGTKLILDENVVSNDYYAYCDECDEDFYEGQINDPGYYSNFISDRLKICFEPVKGIYPSISLSNPNPASLSVIRRKIEEREHEQIQNTISDLITVFKPHQGDLATHLEEEMQELINGYLFLDK